MRKIHWWEWALTVLVALAAIVYLLEFAPRWPSRRAMPDALYTETSGRPADTSPRVPAVVVDSTLFYGGDSSAVVLFMHERTDSAWHDSTSTPRWPR